MAKQKYSFDSKIHIYRATKRMSQQELADLVGVSRQTIIQLERNRYQSVHVVSIQYCESIWCSDWRFIWFWGGRKMIEWITLLLDSRFFMRANGILGFVLLGLFVFFYFSKRGARWKRSWTYRYSFVNRFCCPVLPFEYCSE